MIVLGVLLALGAQQAAEQLAGSAGCRGVSRHGRPRGGLQPLCARHARPAGGVRPARSWPSWKRGWNGSRSGASMPPIYPYPRTPRHPIGAPGTTAMPKPSATFRRTFVRNTRCSSTGSTTTSRSMERQLNSVGRDAAIWRTGTAFACGAKSDPPSDGTVEDASVALDHENIGYRRDSSGRNWGSRRSNRRISVASNWRIALAMPVDPDSRRKP